MYEAESVRQFAGLRLSEPIPDESAILHFRHLLEKHQLGQGLFEEVNRRLEGQGLKLLEGTIVDATIIAAPSSTKNRSWQRDLEMRQVKKGNQHYFGMKLHIGVDAQTGLVHTMRATSANVPDVTEANGCCRGGGVWGEAGVGRLGVCRGAEAGVGRRWVRRGAEAGGEAGVGATLGTSGCRSGRRKRVGGDAGYVGVQKREENRELAVEWQVALKAGQRRKLEPGSLDAYAEKVKASIRAKVEHPFWDVKGLFGYAKSLPSRKRESVTGVWPRTRSGWPYCWDCPTCGGPAASWPVWPGGSAPQRVAEPAWGREGCDQGPRNQPRRPTERQKASGQRALTPLRLNNPPITPC